MFGFLAAYTKRRLEILLFFLDEANGVWVGEPLESFTFELSKEKTDYLKCGRTYLLGTDLFDWEGACKRAQFASKKSGFFSKIIV